jgi:hypothetical protein
MIWFNNNKEIVFDINNLNVVERYEDEEGNDLSDNTVIEDDLLLMLYIKDDLL